MADRTISELTAATVVQSTDLFVLEQNNTAKKLTGQILENWLVSFADGHGGIQSIEKTSTVGLVDTYTITLADTTTFAFPVTNGRSIVSIEKTGTSGLVDTYTITYNDSTTSTFTVANGRSITGITWQTSGTAGDGQTHTGTISYNDGTTSTIVFKDGVKGDTGDATYVWIKWAAQNPTADNQLSDNPDDWIGIYRGSASSAPTTRASYQWYEYKGEKGDTGNTGASIASVTQTGGDGSPGTYDTYTITLDTGVVAGTFQVYNGINGSGSVSSVNNVNPDANGNVALVPANIGAAPVPLHIQQTLSTLPSTIANASITETMRVISCWFGTPAAILSDVDWTITNGSIALSGTMSGTTTIDLILCETT